jgi:hypothetical protein
MHIWQKKRCFDARFLKHFLFRHYHSKVCTFGVPMTTLEAKVPTLCWQRTIVAEDIPSNNAGQSGSKKRPIFRRHDFLIKRSKYT